MSEKEKKVTYLCDGEKPDCKRTHCYKNTDDGLCRHTSDIDHAINFIKKDSGDKTIYREIIRSEIVGTDEIQTKE
ncbi:MAG: hypothetical protein Q4E91_01570 [Lachnospiraceae bacterium]|nr:hypothetical protein [Lachnospiraceae bacterium]